MLLDPETLALAGGVERLLGPAGLKTELFSCLVETNTPVCETAHEALVELERLRDVVREAAGREGLAVAATGAHPFSQPEEQEIVQEPRYLAMLDERPKARRQLVCGVHVHVGMDELRAAASRRSRRSCRGCRRCWRSRSTRRISGRAGRACCQAVPAGCSSCRARGRRRTCPIGRRGSRSSRRSATTRGSGGTSGRIPVSARSRSACPTSRPTCAGRPRSAALLQALCVAAEPPAAPADRGEYLRARERATSATRPSTRLFRLVEPSGRELGTWELVERAANSRRRLSGSSRWVRRAGCARSRPTRRALGWLGSPHAPVGAVRALARRPAARPAKRRANPRRARHRRRRCASGRRPTWRRRSRRIVRCRRRSSGSRRARAQSVPSGSASPVRTASPQPALDASVRRALAGVDVPAGTAVVLLRETTIAGEFASLGGIEGLGRWVPSVPAGCRASAGPSAARCCGCAARAGCRNPRGFVSSRWARRRSPRAC